MATNKDAPFGMRAIGKVGQNDDNQGLSEYNIAASAPAIFQNDAVKALNTATIAQAAAGDTLIGTLNFQSKSELNASTVTTSTAQLRILGVTKDAENNNTSNVTTFATNANFVCSINEHFLKGTVGV